MSNKRGKLRGRLGGFGADWLGFGTYCASSAFIMISRRRSCRRQWRLQAGGSGVGSRCRAKSKGGLCGMWWCSAKEED